MEKILSVIVPVYNVEEYLERCIRSLEIQDLQSDAYEIILVNDGSTDSSRDVILRMLNEYSNIVLIDQENQGVSVARNRGIERASGMYLLFVDADDYTATNTLGSSLEVGIHRTADIVFMGYSVIDSSRQRSIDCLYGDVTQLLNGRDSYFMSRRNGYPDPDRCWGILFKRELIQKCELRFLANVPFLEDGEFMARVLSLSEKCAFLNQVIYVRTIRKGSATGSNLFYQERAIDGFVKAAKNLVEFKEELSSVEVTNFLNHVILKYAILCVQSCVSFRSTHLFSSTTRKLKQNGLKELDLRGCKSIYYYYGLIYNTSISLCFVFLLFIGVIRRIKCVFRSC